MWFYKSNRGKKVEDGQIQCCCGSCSKRRRSSAAVPPGRGRDLPKTGHQDLVTHWDRKIEQLLRNEILTAFPQDSIVGEEYPPEAHRTGAVTWYIDPIDGTTNFINQHQNYAISVGCWEETRRCSAWCWMWSGKRCTGQSTAAVHGRIRRRSTPPAGGSFRSCY